MIAITKNRVNDPIEVLGKEILTREVDMMRKQMVEIICQSWRVIEQGDSLGLRYPHLEPLFMPGVVALDELLNSALTDIPEKLEAVIADISCDLGYNPIEAGSREGNQDA